MIIEHNKHEKRPTNTIWWILAALLLFSWVGYFYANGPDWWAIWLGVASGGVLAIWSLEVTGHLRSKDPSSGS